MNFEANSITSQRTELLYTFLREHGWSKIPRLINDTQCRIWIDNHCGYWDRWPAHYDPDGVDMIVTITFYLSANHALLALRSAQIPRLGHRSNIRRLPLCIMRRLKSFF
jgi:hypothetical protein